MSDRFSKIAFKQIVRKEWMDRTLELVCAGVSEKEIRQYMDNYLSTQQQRGGEGVKRNKETYGMTLSMLSCWFRDDELNSFRRALANEAKKVDRSRWLPFHMAILSASYPFWLCVCNEAGKLFFKQDLISSAQIYDKMKAIYGDRETIARNTRYAIRTMVSWGFMDDVPEQRGCYHQGQKTEVLNPKAISLLLESLLWANKYGRSGFEDLCRNPGLFGFRLDSVSAGMIESLSNGRIERMSYGMSDEYLCLRAEDDHF
ncbi:MAG: hypothetical protein II903_05280 [Spirochaetales bacterium]|nr:hypothetical protein [Spirochaetales bacterium]